MAILLSMGTRPEIIKMAPVYQALRARGAELFLLHTGQHDELAEPFYEFFGMKPDLRCTLDRQGSDLAALNAALVKAVSSVLEREKPEAVLVHGDTTSAFCAALSAFYRKIPVGHVEAGLRSGSFYDPFPEEKNRELIARIASWHFAPTDLAQATLRAENIAAEKIHMVGNTVVDACLFGVGKLQDAPPKELPEAIRSAKKLILVTAHRRENWGEGIRNVARAVKEILQDPQFSVLWPVHANPDVQQAIRAELDPGKIPHLFLCDPIPYAPLLWALQKSWLVLTDSGGIQEEAAALDKPVLVLRKTTERPEVIQSGRGALLGTDQKAIVEKVRLLAKDAGAYSAMLKAQNPYGDGRAGERIAKIVLDELGG